MIVVKYITPNCCEKSKDTKTVRLGFYPDAINYGEWKNFKPKWYISGDTIVMEHHYNTKVELEQCPFCNTILPDIVLNDKNIKICEGDEEYCKTCNKRHMCCKCYPPEYRWKIK